MLEDAEVFDVGLVTEFLDKPRRVQVNGRKVAVFTYKGQIYAIDANCYHSAGALEEVSGRWLWQCFLALRGHRGAERRTLHKVPVAQVHHLAGNRAQLL